MGETRRFSKCFLTLPQPVIGSAGDLRVEFLGISPHETFWRDWFVRIMIAATARFPEIGPHCGVRDAL